MSSLKAYRDRISSVKATRKITSAMKLVAASKLKKNQEAAESSKPYTNTMAEIMRQLASKASPDSSGAKLLTGTGKDKVNLLVVVTASRGLCGGFNGNVIRAARKEIARLREDGKEVRLILIGRKGRDVLKREYPDLVVGSYVRTDEKTGIPYSWVNEINRTIIARFENGEFDVCTLLYSRFKNILVQEPFLQRIIPFNAGIEDISENSPSGSDFRVYSFEPDENKILAALLPKNIGAQIYQALLDSAAGEQAARMTAMDSATSAASDMIDDLTLMYNRERQAVITKELIEIVSGAEAL